MIIKKYTANSIEEAKEKIEEELGPDAIILTSRHLKGKGIKGLFSQDRVEITAAIDEGDLEKYQQSGSFGSSKKKESTFSQASNSSQSQQESLSENLQGLKELMSQYTDNGQKQGEVSSSSSQKASTMRLDITDEQASAKVAKGQALTQKSQGSLQLQNGQDLVSLSSQAQKQSISSGMSPTSGRSQTNNESSTGSLQGKMTGNFSSSSSSSSSLSSSTSAYSPFGQKSGPSQSSNVLSDLSPKELASQAKVNLGKDRAEKVLGLSRRLVEKIQNEQEEPSRVSSAQKQSSSKQTKESSSSDENSSSSSARLSKEIATAVNMQELREMIREEMKQAQYGLKKEVQKATGQLESKKHLDLGFLMAKGISRKIAEEIEQHLEMMPSVEDFTSPSEQRSEYLNSLKNQIAQRIPVTGPLPLKEGSTYFMALVGSTGVGKTTTLAKLASLYAHVFGKRVAIINFDHDKFGEAPISTFARDQQINCFEMQESASLEEMKEQTKGYDLVLIDTAGKSQYHLDEVSKLQSFSERFSQVDLYLTLSATTKDVDLFGAVKAFSTLNIKGLIFTKLDETISWGSIVNICAKTRKPICYLSMGKRVPEDLVLADSQKIAKGILLQHNDSSSQILQRVANS